MQISEAAWPHEDVDRLNLTKYITQSAVLPTRMNPEQCLAHIGSVVALNE